MGEKPSPTSGRVSMEILSGGASSKMKLKNVCPTSPSLQYDTKKSMAFNCDGHIPRSPSRTESSWGLRRPKFPPRERPPRSRAMPPRAIPATSCRHGRSCEGGIEIHHTTTAKNNPRKTADMPRRGDTQQAQTANAAKAADNVKRSAAHGRFE